MRHVGERGQEGVEWVSLLQYWDVGHMMTKLLVPQNAGNFFTDSGSNGF